MNALAEQPLAGIGEGREQLGQGGLGGGGRPQKPT